MITFANTAFPQEKEAVAIEIRRTVPWGRGGGSERPRVKNHPMAEGSMVTTVATRRTVPWGRGGPSGSVRIKNHPVTSDSEN